MSSHGRGRAGPRWFSLFVVLAAPGFTCGQEDPDPGLLMSVTGSLRVTTVDEEGASVVGVRVTLDGEAAGQTPLRLTLEPGTYEVGVDTTGFVAAPGDTVVEVAGEMESTASFQLMAGFPRAVVVEEFTNSGCEGCPEFESLLTGVAEDLGDGLIIVLGLHTNIPDPDDPMLDANALELLRRSRTFYDIDGNPSAALAGRLLPGIPPSEDMVRDSLAAHRRTASPVTLELSWAVNGAEVVADVTIRSIRDVPGDTRLLLMTVQDEIAYDAPPGANGQRVFHHVVRDLAPSHDGDPITITEAMDETRTLTATLFTDAVPPDDLDALECVVVLQDWESGSIIQAVRATVPGRAGALHATSTDRVGFP